MAKLIAKRRHSIRKSQISELMVRLTDEIGDGAEKFRGSQVEVIETSGDVQIYMIDKQPLLLEINGILFPSLRGAVARPFEERRVTVDMGAISFVINGADIMRPGVKAVSPDVKAGRPVQVVDERHGKPLAVGVALLDTDDMLAQDGGKVVKSFHYVGDDIWNLEF